VYKYSYLLIIIIIIIIKMQDLEWHIIMSIIAGALYILTSLKTYQAKPFHHSELCPKRPMQ